MTRYWSRAFSIFIRCIFWHFLAFMGVMYFDIFRCYCSTFSRAKMLLFYVDSNSKILKFLRIFSLFVKVEARI